MLDRPSPWSHERRLVYGIAWKQEEVGAAAKAAPADVAADSARLVVNDQWTRKTTTKRLLWIPPYRHHQTSSQQRLYICIWSHVTSDQQWSLTYTLRNFKLTLVSIIYGFCENQIYILEFVNFHFCLTKAGTPEWIFEWQPSKTFDKWNLGLFKRI